MPCLSLCGPVSLIRKSPHTHTHGRTHTRAHSLDPVALLTGRAHLAQHLARSRSPPPPHPEKIWQKTAPFISSLLTRRHFCSTVSCFTQCGIIYSFISNITGPGVHSETRNLSGAGFFHFITRKIWNVPVNVPGALRRARKRRATFLITRAAPYAVTIATATTQHRARGCSVQSRLRS